MGDGEGGGGGQKKIDKLTSGRTLIWQSRVISVQNSKQFQVANVGNHKNTFKLQRSKICYCQ